MPTQKEKQRGKGKPQAIAGIVSDVLSRYAHVASIPPRTHRVQQSCPALSPGPATIAARFDMDLAEFPLFRFAKSRDTASGQPPLTYADTITGGDGRPVTREWKVYPGPFG